MATKTVKGGTAGSDVTVAADAGVTDTDTQRVVLANDTAIVGTVTEAAPATDTASSGINGRLQRIAQRITTLISSVLNTSANAATMPAATTMQNAAVANGNGTTLNVQGFAVAILNIVSSPAMSGGTTVNFEASVDDVTWVAMLGHAMGVTGALATTTTIDGDFRLQTAGYKSVRARISAYSAGTVTIKGYTSPTTNGMTSVGIAAGTNAIGTVTANAGTNLNTSALALSVNQAALAAVTVERTALSLASSATSAQLLASTAARLGLILNNTDANGVYLYYGTTATATKFTVYIPPNGYWEMPLPIYNGRIDVIWVAAGSGKLIGSEL